MARRPGSEEQKEDEEEEEAVWVGVVREGWDWRVDGGPLVSSAGEPQIRAVIIRTAPSPLCKHKKPTRTSSS